MVLSYRFFPILNINSPAQIRTGVKGSKGLYAWPLHLAMSKDTTTGLPGVICYNLLLYNVTHKCLRRIATSVRDLPYLQVFAPLFFSAS